jgi:3-keto-disaccharide hydrolase
MNRAAIALVSVIFAPLVCQAASPFAGRWDFTVPGATSNSSYWLGVTDANGKLDVWFQPAGGNVFQIKDFQAAGSHLSVTVSAATATRPATVWELDAVGGRLTGAIRAGDKSTAVTGVPSPALKRPEPKAWTAPMALFNGKDLTGWEPIGNISNNHWTVADNLLVNTASGANLKSTRAYTDFILHFEANCPDRANSGFYLRGRYEVQLEYEAPGTDPPERSMGSIYGRITPSPILPRTPGQWESFDIMLVGRTVTISRNGVMTTDHKEIEGITGGALDANEGDPGPFYIQGDHTGGLKFRNITVSVPVI